MKINKRNRVLTDNLRGPKYRDAGATTNSGGLETVTGPCGHLGDAPGMGSVRNRAAAPHTGAVCGVAYTPNLNLRTGVHSDTDNASSPLHRSTWDLTQEAKSQKKPKENTCVCVK